MKKANSRSSPQGGVASSTVWPSCVSKPAACSAAATHSRGTGASISGGVVVSAILSAPGSAPTSSANGRSGGGAQYGSPVSYPAITSRSAAASATVRVIGPLVEKPSSPPYGAGDTRPRAGLIPNRPQHDAGILIDPPPSLPCAAGASPAATAVAAPPLDPPGVRLLSHGLRQGPSSSDSVTAVIPSSGVFVLPSTTKPASFRRRPPAPSNPATYPAQARREY